MREKPVRIHLGFGTLKIKRRRFLRQEELNGEYPMVQLGKHYWIWVADRASTKDHRRIGPRSKG